METKMNKLYTRFLSTAVLLAAVAVPAAADVISPGQTVTGTGPLGQAWTATWSGWNVYEMGSDLTIGGNTLSYDFLHPGHAYFGVPEQTYVFSTTAAGTGQLSLNIDVDSFASWFQAYTEMYIWQGSTDNKQLLAGITWGGTEHYTATLALTQGQEWGFLARGGNGDGTGALFGSFTVTTNVPEPASLALLGLGALGLGFARRKKA